MSTLQLTACERCNSITVKLQTCEICHRGICGKCSDDNSGMCSDCAKAVFRDPDRFLLCSDVNYEDMQIEKELKRKFRQIDESDFESELDYELAIEKVQEEIKEHQNDIYDRINIECKPRACPKCGSRKITLFPDFVLRVYRFHCKCSNCGTNWVSKQRRL